MFKGAGAVGRRVQAAVSMQKLAPHDFKSSAVPALRCATRICCVAEIMQHQTHYRSPLTHEDMLGRDSFEEGFISSSFPASSPSAWTRVSRRVQHALTVNLPVFIRSASGPSDWCAKARNGW